MMMMDGENVNVSVMMMSDGVSGKSGGVLKSTSRLHTHRFPVDVYRRQMMLL